MNCLERSKHSTALTFKNIKPYTNIHPLAHMNLDTLPTERLKSSKWSGIKFKAAWDGQINGRKCKHHFSVFESLQIYTLTHSLTSFQLRCLENKRQTARIESSYCLCFFLAWRTTSTIRSKRRTKQEITVKSATSTITQL